MSELKPCPFCGREAHATETARYGNRYGVACECGASVRFFDTEAEAIEAWNTRAAYEMEGFFYLPKPKEPIVEVTKTTNTWDGTKVRTDVFYQVRKQAIVNWARELDENIIKRICEVWNTQAERTCHNISEDGFLCSVCSFGDFASFGYEPSYCPNCGARVTPKCSETTPKVVSE